MNKTKKAITGFSILSLLGGCSEQLIQRDVYRTKEDCLEDWEKTELCEYHEEESSSSGGGGGSSGRWRGPSYYQDNREVELKNGQKIKPKGNHSSDKPIVMKGSLMDAISRPVKRGGFSGFGKSSGG